MYSMMSINTLIPPCLCSSTCFRLELTVEIANKGYTIQSGLARAGKRSARLSRFPVDHCFRQAARLLPSDMDSTGPGSSASFLATTTTYGCGGKSEVKISSIVVCFVTCVVDVLFSNTQQ